MTERAYIEFARELWTAFHLKYYTKYGHNTFEDFVTKEVGVSKSYADQMRRVFSVLVMKCNISPRDLDIIGRSKARKLLTVVDRSNARDWVEKAKRLPYDEFVGEVDKDRLRSAPMPDAVTSPDSFDVTPVNPSLGGEVPRVVNDPRIAKFKVRTFRLPEDSTTLLDEAIGEAQRITKSASDGFNLTCIAQQFLAHRLTAEGKDDGRLTWFMRMFERVYGTRLIQIKKDEGWNILREAVEKHPDLLGTSAEERTDERGCDSGGRDSEGETES